MSLFQNPKRMIPKSERYEIKLSTLKLARIDPLTGLDVLEKNQCWDPENIVEYDSLPPGDYIIKGDMEWTGDNKFNNFVISVYAREKVDLIYIKNHKLARFINFGDKTALEELQGFGSSVQGLTENLLG